METTFNHVALPSRLPGKGDNKIDIIERVLTDRLLDASRTIRDHTRNEFGDSWDYIRRSLGICKVVSAGAHLNKISLLSAFRKLEHRELLILHVAEQNAGLLIRRQHRWVTLDLLIVRVTLWLISCSSLSEQGESVIFEAVEASPISEKVLASKNALQWDLLGCAIAIPYSEFTNSSFQDNLATFLEQASTESIRRFAAHTNKAGSFAFESRDTVDPSLITEMLMTLLEVNGYRIFPTLLRKRVRDDVC